MDQTEDFHQSHPPYNSPDTLSAQYSHELRRDYSFWRDIPIICNHYKSRSYNKLGSVTKCGEQVAGLLQIVG